MLVPSELVVDVLPPAGEADLHPREPDPPAPSAPAVSRTRALVEAIQQRLPGTRVLLTDNRSTLLSQAVRDGVRTARVHQMFLDAPDNVRTAVAQYLATGDDESRRAVDAFIGAQQHLLSLVARPLREGAHRGRTHDLLPLFVALNRLYFQGAIEAELGWGLPGSPQRRRRRSITFGTWDARARRILIHPVLDEPEVPELCVARVVHHEMLHAHHGEGRDRAGRRVVHGPAFRADEARFAGAREADAWFDAHLDLLLAWRPGRNLARGLSRKPR